MKHLVILLLSVLMLQTAVAVPDGLAELSTAELESIAAPIALYPDPLLGLILPASVFPDQIVDAALLIKTKTDAELISQQSWDASVKGVATYPGVLKMMYEKIDWTTKLGDAFINQSSALRGAIFSLRLKAQKVGNLSTTEEQKVTTEVVKGETVVRIEPTTTEVVYVPQYSTQVVYTEPAKDDSNYLVPLATFGLGMAMGAAMADHDDGGDVNIYGGYPGRVNWYNNNSVNNWADNRQDMIKDSQNHRQDVQKDRVNYRQDANEDRRNFRQDQVESGNYGNKAARQDFNQEQSAKRQDYAKDTQANRQNNRSNATANSENYQAKKQQAQQRSQEWKSSAADKGWSSESKSSRQSARSSASSSSARSYSSSSGTSKSSAMQGYSSRSSTSAYSSRAASSRSQSGYSRSSGGGGGGRSASRSGGGGGGRKR